MTRIVEPDWVSQTTMCDNGVVWWQLNGGKLDVDANLAKLKALEKYSWYSWLMVHFIEFEDNVEYAIRVVREILNASNSDEKLEGALTLAREYLDGTKDKWDAGNYAETLSKIDYDIAYKSAKSLMLLIYKHDIKYLLAFVESGFPVLSKETQKSLIEYGTSLMKERNK